MIEQQNEKNEQADSRRGALAQESAADRNDSGFEELAVGGGTAGCVGLGGDPDDRGEPPPPRKGSLAVGARKGRHARDVREELPGAGHKDLRD